MASKKHYSYYLRGNQIALIEEDTGLGSGTCSLSNYKNKSACENAGGTWTAASTSGADMGQYKSPQESIADGLEIEYAYSPRYTLESTGTEGTDFHKFIGWGSDGTNLLLFTYAADAVKDLSSLFAADDYIYVKGSGRWSGLHQVKSTGGATGILTLKTKCNLKPSTISVAGTFATDGTFNGDNAAADMDIEVFKDLISTYDGRETPYVFINVAVDAVSNGIFSVTYGSTSGEITFGNKITIDADGDYTSTAEAITAESGDTISIYNMFYEQISVFEGVNVLNDESDTIDLPEYLTKALVYYVKAQMAEDRGDIDQFAYNRKQFRALMQRYESSRTWGSRRVFPGIGAIR